MSDGQTKKSRLLLNIFLINLLVPLAVFLHNSVLLNLYNPYITAGFNDRLIMGLLKNIFLFVFIAIDIPASLFIAFLLKPVERAIDNPLLIETAKKRIITIPIVVLVVHLSGFLSGTIISYSIPGGVALNDFIFVFLVSLFSGLYSFAFSYGLMDYEIYKAKRSFNIVTLGENDKELPIFLKVLLTVFSAASLTYAVSQYIGWYFYKKGVLADTGNFFINTLVNITIIVLISLVHISLVVTTITNIIKDVRMSVNSIITGKGNLKNRLVISSYDELGLLVSDFNKLLDFLTGMIRKIKQISDKIENSNSVLINSIDSSKGIFKEFITSINKIISDVEQNSSYCSELKNATQSISTAVDSINIAVTNQNLAIHTSSSSTEQMLTGIKNVSNTIGITNREVHGLYDSINMNKKSLNHIITYISGIGNSSQEVLGLIHIINDIYERIKLLAINASIEAARAGSHGVGFEVVATEVRKLSDASSSSVKNIETQVNGMNAEITSGISIVAQTVKELESVFSVVENTINAIEKISYTMNEQNSGTQIIIRAISDLVNSSSELNSISMNSKVYCDQLNKIVYNLVDGSTAIKQHANNQKNENLKLVEMNQNLINASKSLKDGFESLKELLGSFEI